jgi:hypothetical protein
MCIHCLRSLIVVFLWGGALGSVMIKALCNKSEGRGLETRLGKLFFSTYIILPAALGPGVYSASNRNEHHKQENDISEE